MIPMLAASHGRGGNANKSETRREGEKAKKASFHLIYLEIANLWISLTIEP